MGEGPSSALHFDSFLMQTGNDKGTKTIPLYPFHPVELAVVFVYGADFTRQMNVLSYPKSVQIMSALIVLFMGLAALTLSIIRRKWKLRRGSFISASIDTLIAFIAGGNLRMRHKLERLFFGIVLIGVFFITSIYAGDLLDCTYRILHQKIDTFDQLKTIQSPIYINRSLKMYTKDIWEIVKYVLMRIFDVSTYFNGHLEFSGGKWDRMPTTKVLNICRN